MPKQVEIDLGVTVLPDNHKIWKLFAGEGYKFLNLMLESGIVFIDVRNLNELGPNPSEWNKRHLLEHVSEDRWARQTASTGIQTERRISSNDKLNTTLIEGLLLTARKGDIVAIPHHGSDGYVTIGQLTSRPGVTKTIVAQDGRRNYTYVGRRFKELCVLNKRDLPFEFIERLQTPIAFFDTGDAARDEVYEAAYGSYIYDGVNFAKYSTSKEVYTSRDNRTVSTWMEFVDVISNTDALISAKLKTETSSIVELIDRANLEEIDRSDLSININSPGEIIMKAIANSPLIGLAIYPMAAAGVAYSQAVQAQIIMKAVGDATTNECEAEIGQDVKNVLEALGAKRWQAACEVAVRAANETTLKTDSSLKS